MPDAIPVWDVSEWEVVHPEALGRERKVWLRETGAATNSRERDWLFKPVIVPANGHRQGEDWAEKIVSELGRLLGVPCAEVELAVRHGVEGSISRNVAPDGWNLVVGANYLGAVLDSYTGGENPPAGRPGHSPSVVMAAIADCGPPPGHDSSDARTMFAGYLVLDAWVANQDRHDQNWAVLRQTAAPGHLRLAPSYDHASGVGANLRDSYRRARLTSRDVRRFAERARAHRFEHDPRAGRASIPTLVRTADDALHIAGGAARAHWTARLAAVDRTHTEPVVLGVPGLSDLTLTFILELLDVNRKRVLDECG